MMVRLDVTVATAPLAAGLLSGLAIGDHVVYLDLSSVNYASNTVVGGNITAASVQNITAGDVVGNATFNRIDLTSDKY